MANCLRTRGAAVAACLWLCLPVTAAPARDGMMIPVRTFLCDSADHAIQFADMLAKGESEEIAKDRVGRGAAAEVCGRYAGIATIESEAVTVKGGIAYRVTAYRFREDNALAWLAETSFAPTASSWNL